MQDDAVREARKEVSALLREKGGELKYDTEKESGLLCDMARKVRK